MKRKKLKKQRKIITISAIILLLTLSIGYSAFQTNITLNLKGNIKEKQRVIKSWEKLSNEDFHTDFYRENIITATFLDDITVPVEAIKTWDISEDKKGGVIAYIKESKEENGKYDLYITAKGGVIANPDSSSLFYNFKSLKEINFNNNFDTRKVKSMIYMFAFCKNLISLDLSNFDTQNVIRMGGMFEECSSLETLNLSNFDTSNVTSMWYMFARCNNLKKLDLSNFNTSNVTEMQSMFAFLSAKEINICSFDTKKVLRMDKMFYGTRELKNIYTGINWTINQDTEITDMFTESNISSVTTDKCEIEKSL